MEEKSAFPWTAMAISDRGMTLRDYFAIHASNDEVTAYFRYNRRDGHHPISSELAEARYAFADAMLRAREKSDV